ncbi:MAG: hypothetical protein ACRD0K_06040 [Egibacteraceae bacterium]
MTTRETLGRLRSGHGIVRLAAALALAVGALGAPAAPASAAPDTIVVTLRVEGATSTIFERPVTTDGHDVTTAAGGTHRCDGTNNNANPKPGPTATAALDDAAKSGGFTFDGTYSAEFDDFFITRLGPDEQTDTAFIGIFRDSQLTPVGGCQQRVEAGDEVLFAYDAFTDDHGAKPVLELVGPDAATIGDPITVTVTDGATGSPVAGATVDGATTGPDGTAEITFDTPGVTHLKAELPDAIRSNSLPVTVTS